MLNFRPTYEPLIKLCKELIAEKKVLMEENEELKETLRCIRQDNQELREKLFGKPNDDKLADLEKRVAYLEDRLSPVEVEGEQGWKANKREHLVDSERAWYVDDTEIELLEETERDNRALKAYIGIKLGEEF